ncbi:MAG: helix-turn-helix transcriptional regulator [Blastochloris sp.]|nr:helix-turn-helix transcriptional regulator [Blastochloris sp.]
MQRFGEKLKTLRKRQGMTLQELSHRLGHADHTYLSRVENGKKMPSIELILVISHMFDVTTDELLKDDLEVE